MQEKKNIKLPHVASALTSTDSTRVPSRLAQYNLVGLPNTNHYNVCCVLSNNSKKKLDNSDHIEVILYFIPAY